MKETDLYESVKLFLEQLGFAVQAEVCDCDVVAVKEGQTVIVELKRNLTVRLLSQAVQRQKLGAEVYVAVPKPSRYRYDKKHRELLHLLRRLELGLLFVSPEKQLVEAALHPDPLDRKRLETAAKKKKKALEQELEKRNFSLNCGGSSGVKIMTAYREQALFFCCALERMGEASPKEVSGLVGVASDTVGAILRRNVYGWFTQIGRGRYRLSEQGGQALEQYPTVAEFYRKKLREPDRTEEE